MQHSDWLTARSQVGTRGRVLVVALALGVCGPASAAPEISTIPVEVAGGRELADLSLNELMNIEITTVSKRAEPLFRAAGAVAKLSGDDIRRSGVRTIAEALRLIPGVQVRRTSAQGYNITARGFTGDKLEVLVDGRSVYTPLNSIVFWDLLDTYLPDIERIEVIRGPGATLWGANAMNGVINIVTRSAHDTQGSSVGGGGGNEQRAFVSVRSGEPLGDTGHVRFYAKALDLDSSRLANGDTAPDGQSMQLGGFRYDGALSAQQDLNISGDVYTANQTSAGIGNEPIAGDASGGNLKGFWSYRMDGGDSLSIKTYYDHYKRLIPEVYDETRDTGNLDFQHHISIGSAHQFIYGVGYRISRDQTGPLLLYVDPEDRTTQTIGAFIQDQWSFADDNAQLTVGSKFEHNDFTGFEVQPGVRLGWQLGHDWFSWGAVSRAVRTPNRIDSDIAIFCSPQLAAFFPCTSGERYRIGNPDFESENLIAYEWGARYSASRNLSFDLATYFNDYSDLKSTESSPPPFGTFENNVEGEAFGAELSVRWALLESLELQPFYAFLKTRLHTTPDSTDTRTADNTEGSSPRHSAGLRVAYNPLPDFTVDGFVRHVGELPALAVPAYTELNLRLAWRPWEVFELALVGENLLDARHPESGSAASASQPAARSGNELERSVFAQMRWTWK